MIKDILHFIFGCWFEVKGWSPLGAPVEQCTHCGQWAVLYGSVNAYEHLLTEQQAKELML